MRDEIHCEEANLGENIKKLKNLRPGIAVAQSPEQILTCLQQKQRQRRRVTQELNGLCVLLTNDLQEKAFINLTDIIETKLSKNEPKRRRRSDNTDGISNMGLVDATSSTCQNPESAYSCKGKDSTGESSESGYKILNTNNNNNYIEEEEEEDESDLRTEIAIVLDGSGSIEPEDFEQAKDFIYNVMKMFYEKCFECVFALVQYGTVIQTEFDLRDGGDASSALKKVQAVRQVGNATRTASAIKHVLDSIFNETHGSQINAAKFIIVLTDGEIFLDPLNLDTVINSAKMVGIDRYAIGVGSAFNKTKALQELSLIASDPDESHLFRVTNYSALNVLLSTLQHKIIGLEGTAGDILEFELAQSGFSVHFLDNDHILFGAVGAFDWSGGILLYSIANKTAFFLNESMEASGVKNSYLGYSVSAVNTEHGTLIVAGAPRHCMTGRVMVFEGDHLKQTLQGEQIGSYFGSELCPLDIDQDGLTDYLLVGAPFFHILGEEGKVYIYHLDKERNLFALVGHLRGQPALAFARFGFSVTGIGDINQDGYGDVAVGAPLEDHQANPSSFGTVYIYNGNRDGVQLFFSQRITAAQIGPGLVYFGRSMAGGLDLTKDGLPDIIVGSLGNLTVLRSRLVIRLDPTVQFTPGKIFNFYNTSIITAKVCFNRTYPLEAAQPETQNLFIRYTVDLDVKTEKKRAQFKDHTTTTTREVSYTDLLCPELQLYILPCKDDCFSSILLKVGYQLHNPDEDLYHPVPILDINQLSEADFELPYKDDCNKTICAPRLNLTVQTQKELVVGYTKFLTMSILLANSGDNSYMTSMVLEYPSNLLFKNVQELSTPVIDCDAPKPTILLFSSMRCKIGHPAFKATAANFSVTWQVDEKKFPDNSAFITATVTNANNSTALIEKHVIRVKYALTTILSRPSQVVYVTVGERSSESLQFEFNINGKNQYGAQFQLFIGVPACIDDLLVASVQSATGTQGKGGPNSAPQSRVFEQGAVWRQK
ncbi:integrin alpha-E [Tiliqua scincoides]|uniref:integrin alpha-E n=1 Tax=Tiliqua scincoides TaxID=71010 RepID=UPI003461D85E